MIKIKYFLNNVDQCWSCKNCIGSSQLITLSQMGSQIKDMIEYDIGCGDNGAVILPECKVMDKYMLEVYERTCPKYEVKKDE